jgi:CBS domain containing-hemolysin-like protein
MFEIISSPFFLIIATLALVLVNGVFVAAEFAIVRVRRTRLEELAGQGLKAAKNAIVLVDHVSEYLAVTQIVCRPLIKIPLDLSQDKILRLLQEGHGHMGVVRDLSDKRTLGIVTLEDVLESLLGDVREAKPSALRTLKGPF